MQASFPWESITASQILVGYCVSTIWWFCFYDATYDATYDAWYDALHL